MTQAYERMPAAVLPESTSKLDDCMPIEISPHSTSDGTSWPGTTALPASRIRSGAWHVFVAVASACATRGRALQCNADSSQMHASGPGSRARGHWLLYARRDVSGMAYEVHHGQLHIWGHGRVDQSVRMKLAS
eukprot:jgi/Ulvmu1/7701/UM039_0005.1